MKTISIKNDFGTIPRQCESTRRGSLRFGVRLCSLLCLIAAAMSACSGGSSSPSAAPSQGGAIPGRPEEIAEQPISFALPGVDRWVMPNGLVVLYKFDDELPMMSGKLFLRGGSLEDPPNLVGLARATGAAMRDGSVTGIEPAELDRILDRLAASIESSFGAEYGTVGFSCLTEDFPTVFELFGKVVQQPSFDEARFRLWQRLAREGVKRRRDDPSTVAGLTLNSLIYGESTPWGRLESDDSLKRITRNDLVSTWKRFARPDGGLLALSGSLPANQVRAAIEARFGAWKKGLGKLPVLPPVRHVPQPGVYVLDRDFDQATIYMGHFGPPRLTPDVYQMSIYNRVLSGGFGSVLFDEIRTKRGLVYDIDGGLSPGAVKGMFTIALATRNEAALLALQESIRLVAGTLTELPSEQRFQESKSAVERGFIFRFDDSSEVVQRAATQELLKYPPDFDRTYLERIGKVTPEMVRTVAVDWVKPKDLVIVIVSRLKPEEVAAALRDTKIPVYRFAFDTKPTVIGRVP